ncbi:kinase-like domain-containing protein [Suillus subluteus]|nr:kinase-like domain-containing protein [Suillus subluteus]
MCFTFQNPDPASRKLALPMTRPAPKRDIPSDFTSQISALKLEDPCESGAFGDVYQRTINTSEGTTEVAVKVFKIDSRRPVEKYEKAMRRELNVWLKLSKHPTIVPILGIAHVGFQLPVLVSQWMPSGTLYKYLERGTIRTASEKVELAKGVADGLTYLHSENVVHGDLHPPQGNVLIDGSGNPCLADFGLATVVGEPELQWGATTAEDGPARPDFKSDIYSFGGVMFFIVSGDIPWKEKKHSHIIIALSKNVEHPRPDSILNKHWNLIQKCWCWDPWDRPKAVEVLRSLHITGLVIEDDTLTDFTSQNFDVSRPCAYGSFSSVCRCTIQTGEGTTEVAVKVLVIDPRRSQEKLESSLRRELVVWLKLSKSPYIVPLLGVAKFDSPLPALVSEWMPSGTLSQYLEKHAATITPSARVELAKGVAGGVNYLRSESVVHGALHPGDVLIDSSGNPRLTDFGLATVVGDQELQWTTTTAACNFNSRWRAPEVIGIERDKPERPTFESDIYSLGSVIFFIISGDIPWKEKNSSDQISIELAKKATPTRSENIPNGLWNLIQKCWSWEPKHRPEAEKVLEYANLSGIDDLQASISNQPVDLTGQIIGQINDFVAGGTFANVYRCECKQASGRIKVAVKVIKFSVSKEELERFHHETKIWAVLEHDHIIRLLGTARGLGPFQAPALIFPWVETTLSGVIEKEGAKLNIRSKLELLIGTVSALEHLHGLGIVHGDVTSVR